MGRQDGQASGLNTVSPTTAGVLALRQRRAVQSSWVESQVRVAPGSRDRLFSPPPGGANPDQYFTLLRPRTVVKVWLQAESLTSQRRLASTSEDPPPDHRRSHSRRQRGFESRWDAGEMFASLVPALGYSGARRGLPGRRSSC